MRTTLTLDEDVAALLNKEVRKTGEPFKVTPINLGLPDFDKVEELLEYLEGPDYR